MRMCFSLQFNKFSALALDSSFNFVKFTLAGSMTITRPTMRGTMRSADGPTQHQASLLKGGEQEASPTRRADRLAKHRASIHGLDGPLAGGGIEQHKKNKEAGIGDDKGRLPSNVKAANVTGICTVCKLPLKMDNKKNLQARQHVEGKHAGKTFEDCFPEFTTDATSK